MKNKYIDYPIMGKIIDILVIKGPHLIGLYLIYKLLKTTITWKVII